MEPLLRRSAADMEILEECAQGLRKAEEGVLSVRRKLQDMVTEANRDELEVKSETPQLRRVTLPAKTKSCSLRYEYEQAGAPMDNVAFNAFNGRISSDRTSGRTIAARRSSSLLKLHGFTGFQSGEEFGSIVWQRLWRFVWLPMLHPESPFRLVWLTPAFVFVLGEAFLVPFMLSFDVDTQPNSVLGIAFRVVDLYFLADILVTFLTGFRHRHGALVLLPSSVATKYMTGWFALDAVAAIPWSWIGDSTAAQMTRSLKVVRLVRLARLLRLAKLRQITEAAEMFMEGKYLAELIMGFGKVLLLLCAVAHWCACFWHAVGNEEGGWVREIEKSFVAGEDPMFVRYTWSLYFTLTTLTTVGYGDIKPETTAECRYVLLLLLTSAVIFSGLLGMLSDLVASMNKEHRVIAHKKRNLARYMAWRAVPRNLLFKVRRYLLFKWGAQKDYDLYEEELKRTLTPTLRSELCYHIFKDVLQAAPFLAWMRGYKACIQQLATSVRSTFQDSGDFLFRAGDEIKDLHILLAGSVFLYRRDGDAERHAREDLVEKDYVELLADWEKLATSNKAPTSRVRRSVAVTVGRVGRLASALRGGRKRHQNALASSSTTELDLAFFGSCYSENLARGLQELSKQDTMQRQAAEFIQAMWRDHQARTGVIKHHHRNPFGYPVDAPAYFGESSLWMPPATWKSQAILHGYTVRCKTQVELISIPRAAIGNCIENFSPWLLNRFEIFQSAVLAAEARVGNGAESPINQVAPGLGKDAGQGKESPLWKTRRRSSSRSNQLEVPGTSWDKVRTMQVVPASSDIPEDAVKPL